MRLSLALLLAFAASPLNGQTTQRMVGDVVPGAEWQQASPESVGYSSAMLEAMRGWLKTQDTGSMMVMVQGRVIDKSYRAAVSPSSYIAILSMIANANCGDNCKATSGPEAPGPGVHK